MNTKKIFLSMLSVIALSLFSTASAANDAKPVPNAVYAKIYSKNGLYLLNRNFDLHHNYACFGLYSKLRSLLGGKKIDKTERVEFFDENNARLRVEIKSAHDLRFTDEAYADNIRDRLTVLPKAVKVYRECLSGFSSEVGIRVRDRNGVLIAYSALAKQNLLHGQYGRHVQLYGKGNAPIPDNELKAQMSNPEELDSLLKKNPYIEDPWDFD